MSCPCRTLHTIVQNSVGEFLVSLDGYRPRFSWSAYDAKDFEDDHEAQRIAGVVGGRVRQFDWSCGEVI